MNEKLQLFFELFYLLAQLLYEYCVSFVRLFYKGPEKSIKDQVVLITGAGSGLGRLVSIKLAKKGAKIVGWDINEEGLRETQTLINSEFPESEQDNDRFTFAKVDITNRHQVYEEAEKIGKPVDILINNAGIVTRNKFIADKDDVGIIKTFEVNIISHFWTLKAFLPKMMEQNRGHIVTIASVAGYGGSARLTDYNASKFAAVGFHESIVFELREQGFTDTIPCTIVCPYIIDTGMFAGCGKNKIDFLLPILQPDYVANKIVEGILYNQREVIVPKLCGVVAATKFLVPNEGWMKLIIGLGVLRVFSTLVGRSKDDKDDD